VGRQVVRLKRKDKGTADYMQMVGGMFDDSSEGVPQGGLLKTLLGNVMLNECDW
jgi:hypothetical protein